MKLSIVSKRKNKTHRMGNISGVRCKTIMSAHPIANAKGRHFRGITEVGGAAYDIVDRWLTEVEGSVAAP